MANKKTLCIIISILIASGIGAIYHRHLYAATVSDKIERYLQKYSKENILSGAILIAQDDMIIYQHAFGYADVASKRLNTVGSQFLIASITKQITAVAILKLVEQRKLQLDQPVSRYIPVDSILWNGSMPAWADQVTIHQLLAHTSGLANYVALPSFNDFYSAGPHTTGELIQLFAYEPLEFEPGTRFVYSGAGYQVLGAIIEEVTKESYGTFLQKEFFDPLHMMQTIAPHQEMLSQLQRNNQNISNGYSVDEDTKEMQLVSLDANMASLFAEACIISTVHDMYQWTRALYENRIVSLSMRNRMLHPELPTWDDEVGYGVFAHDIDGISAYGHDGMVNGYRSILLYIPSGSVTIVILSNEMMTEVDGIAKEIVHILKNERIIPQENQFLE